MSSMADGFRKKLSSRLKDMETTSEKLEKKAYDIRSTIVDMAEYTKEISEVFLSKAFSDDEYLDTAGHLDIIKTYLVIVVSKITEDGSRVVKKEGELSDKLENLPKMEIKETLQTILHYSSLVVNEITKMMENLFRSYDEAVQLENGSESLDDQDQRYRENSQKLRLLEDKIDIIDVKLSVVQRTLSLWNENDFASDKPDGSHPLSREQAEYDDNNNEEEEIHEKVLETDITKGESDQEIGKEEEKIETTEDCAVEKSEVSEKASEIDLRNEKDENMVEEQPENDNSNEEENDSNNKAPETDMTKEESGQVIGEENKKGETTVVEKSEVSTSNAPDVEDGSGLKSVPVSSSDSKVGNLIHQYRVNQLKKIKRDLGQFGSGLSCGVYEEAKVWYVDGPPDRFWLSVATPALASLNRNLQKSLKSLSSKVGEGDMVVARYSQDGKVYRAKVVAVMEVELLLHYFVLYLDYGNTAIVKEEDLFEWDPLLEMIQPQAHLCSFLEIPATKDLSGSFVALMRSQGMMKLKIHKVSDLPTETFRGSLRSFESEVELWVSLTTEDGRDVLQSYLDLSLTGPVHPLDHDTTADAVEKVTGWLKQVEAGSYIEDAQEDDKDLL